MIYSELKRRLGSHLVGETDETFHTDEDREAAIKDAYELINEMYALTIGSTVTTPGRNALPGEDVLPVDFVSWTTTSGKYVASPSELIIDTDEPWEGKWESYHPLITIKAAQLLWENKGEEYFDKSEHWAKRFEAECARIKQASLRRQRAVIESLNVGPGTFGELLYKVSAALQKDLATEEDILMKFPMELRESFIRDSYNQITLEHELWPTVVTGTVDVNTEDYATIPVPAGYVASSTDTLILEGKGKLGKIDHATLLRFDPMYSNNSERKEGNARYYVLDTTEQGATNIILVPYDTTARTFRFKYLSQPPALEDLTDKPWSGKYSNFVNLIYLRTMKELYRANPDMINISRYFANEYDTELKEFKKYLKNERRTPIVLKMGGQSTGYGGVRDVE
jgi:hypothetical protein